MAKTRRDPKGRTLQRGEIYIASRKLYRFSYIDPMGDRRQFYSKNLLALRDKEKEIRKDSLDGIDSYARANCTLDFLFERFMSIKKGLRSSTRTNYFYSYNRYVKPKLGNRKIGDIKYSDIRYLYQSLIDDGLSINTLDSVHRVIYSSLKVAVRDDILRKNPAEGVLTEIKSVNKGNPPKRALSHAEETEFLKMLNDPKYERWRPLFVFMFGTGCRIGEVIGIRWEDIDFDKNEISINHDITYGPREELGFKCAYEVGPPKTSAGNRLIPMLAKVKTVLEEERSNQKKFGYSNTSVVDGMSGFIFCNRYGELQKPSNINEAINRIVEDHNAAEEVRAAQEDRKPVMIPHFSCHITRHTFCTRLCENGTNIKLIQQIMGHADIRTTMDIYAEVTRDKTHSVFQGFNDDDVL